MNITELKDRARAKLILFYGIDEPTEQQIAAYILFGERSLNRRTL